MSSDNKAAADLPSVQAWEEQAAIRLQTAADYETRKRAYREIYRFDNAYWLRQVGRYGMSGQCAQNRALLRQACPGHGAVLDVGGGLGVAGDAFDPRRPYIVCDAAPVNLEGERVPRRVAGYATELPFGGGTFEAVLILDVLEHLHIEDLHRAVSEARRVLRIGGRLLMATPSRLSGPWDSRAGSGALAERRPGLHLNELTVAEMVGLARANKMRPLAFAVKEQRALRFFRPVEFWVSLHERLTAAAPRQIRKRLCRQAILLAEAA